MQKAQCHECADQQLPSAKMRQEKSRGGLPVDPQGDGRRGKGQRRNPGDERRLATAKPAPGEPQNQRIEDVEDLLHRERPGMQDRLELGLLVEIADLALKQDARDKQGRCDQGPREPLGLGGVENQVCRQCGDRQHRKQRR